VAFFHRVLSRMQNDAKTRGANYPVMSTTSGDSGYTVASMTLTAPTITSPTINSMVGLRPVIDTGGAFATPIVLTSADSGKTYLLDDVAGLDFTLPVISTGTVGMVFRFYVVTTLTSNSYRFTSGEATDLMMGNVLIVDKDAATGDTNALFSVFRPDQSDDDALTIGGSADTSGRLTGGWLEFEAITATRWFIRGILIGDGSLVTLFA
jgi:hypothetical protein